MVRTHINLVKATHDLLGAHVHGRAEDVACVRQARHIAVSGKAEINQDESVSAIPRGCSRA